MSTARLLAWIAVILWSLDAARGRSAPNPSV